MRFARWAAIAIFAGLAAACSSSGLPSQSLATAPAAVAPPAANDLTNIVVLETRFGAVKIRLRPDIAPNHVERVKLLVRQGFYNGIKWHRVIPGFMAQTGDPKGDGSGGSTYPDLKAEFKLVQFRRGTVGAARSSRDSANSQFFICFADAPALNGEYTAWGEVIEGMHFIDKIATGEPPANPDIIVRMYLASEPPA